MPGPLPRSVGRLIADEPQVEIGPPEKRECVREVIWTLDGEMGKINGMHSAKTTDRLTKCFVAID